MGNQRIECTARGRERSPSRRRLLGFAVVAAMSASSVSALSQPSSTAAPTARAAPLKGRWLDTELSADERAEAALAAMTQDEKLALLRTPLGMISAKRAGLPVSAGFIVGVPRLGIPPVLETDASLGVANLGDMRKGDTATALPSSLALGASWDPELAYRGGAMIGSEARSKGFGIMLAGGSNLVRDPRGGRNFEYVSEDPLLSGVLAGKSIAGVQSNHIISTMKHFALNDQETGRNVYSVDMPEEQMRESDLLAFEIANEIGRPGSIMCGYNRVNAIYVCENKYLLSEVLRRDWGFEGFVMSDWGAVHSLGALISGLDQESGFQLDRTPWFGRELVQGLQSGAVSQAGVDDAAKRILRTLFAEGVVDNPPQAGLRPDEAADAAVAQAEEEAGIVVLKNQAQLLPLARTVKRIAVIGGHADLGVLAGGGSTQVEPVGGWTLKLKNGPGVPSWLSRAYGGSAPLTSLRAALPGSDVTFVDGSDPTAAAAIAAKSDVAIVFAEKWSYESGDSADMALGGGQDELIAAVAKANSKTIVVLETGNPVSMPWRGNVGAILAAWYPGQRGGEAIARVLTGAVDPSGRLPITWPASLDQIPEPGLPGADAPRPSPSYKGNFGENNDRAPFSFSYREGADVGYRWFDRMGRRPLYAFGYGLTYTRFRYDHVRMSGGSTVRVTLRVTNTGARPGADVPQVYVKAPGRAKHLVGWSRVVLAPGASKDVTVTADRRLFADFDAARQAWIVRPGRYRVEIARSAGAPVQSQEVEVSASVLPARADHVPASH